MSQVDLHLCDFTAHLTVDIGIFYYIMLQATVES